MNTVERARGRWPEILAKLGVELRFLTKRQGPCPMCGGKTRFRFDDREGDGWFYCNHCGPGPGIILLRKLHGWDHAAACREVDRIIGTDAKPAAPPPVRQRGDAAKLRAIEQLMSRGSDESIVAGYLTSRGLAVSSPVLFGRRRCAYFDDDSRLVGHFSAVVAPIVAPDGKLICAHRIYLAALDPNKKNTEVAGCLNGAAVRLHEVRDEMGIGEGIETCLAAHQLFGTPMWAALTAHGLQTFQPPAGLVKLHILGDNDSSFTGQAAAFSIAHRLGRTRPEIETVVSIPRDADTDWLDVLVGRVTT